MRRQLGSTAPRCLEPPRARYRLRSSVVLAPARPIHRAFQQRYLPDSEASHKALTRSILRGVRQDTRTRSGSATTIAMALAPKVATLKPVADQADVYLTNATTTSQGAGPGPKTLPRAEAAALVSARLAIWGDQPPRGW